jgi:hypothetical protein
MKACLFLGDVVVAGGLTLVLLLLGFVLLYPVFFRLLWRPYRARCAHRLKLDGYRHFAEERGRDFDARRYPLNLSRAWHRRLHLDPAGSPYRLSAQA